MKNKIVVFGIIVIMSVFSCQTFEENLTDPNNISEALADPDLILNAVQTSFADFFEEVSGTTSRLVRHRAMIAGFTYNTSYPAADQNDMWNYGYQDVLINAKLLLKSISEDGKTKLGRSTHAAIAKILSAYVYLTLVDVFGDIPTEESGALDPTTFNPPASTGKDAYTYALKLLTEAKEELAKTEAVIAPAKDIFYAGSRANWTALANTLELKVYMNLALTDPAGAIAKATPLLAANLIDTEAENFTYKWGTSTVPDSRHPIYNTYYDPNAGTAGGYINNGFMYRMYYSKGVQDPRWRYYFYRQVGSIAQAKKDDPKSVGCAEAALDHYIEQGFGTAFCTFDPGFYGRDHADASGTNPDSRAITCVGPYPYGGRPDLNPVSNTSYQVVTQRGQGANGAGISPIFMSFYTDFIKAEAFAKLGQAANAKAALLDGINKSITQVRNFSVSKGQGLTAGLEPSTIDYIEVVTKEYDVANADGKLLTIAEQYYYALFGNGIEAYNLYRRIPTLQVYMEPTLSTVRGVGNLFLRTLYYPQDYVTNNNTAKQKSNEVETPVFWDNWPSGTFK